MDARPNEDDKLLQLGNIGYPRKLAMYYFDCTRIFTLLCLKLRNSCKRITVHAINCCEPLIGLEEGTEQFHHTDTLLNKVCRKVTGLEFYGALWRCILSSSHVRLTALQLVYRRFDRSKSTDDQLFIIGPNVDVMVRIVSIFSKIFLWK